MSAKDYFRADIASVYQNTEEFAETVKINGIEILAIPDGELLQQRTRQNYGNIAVGDVLLHIAETEWDKIPSVSRPPKAEEAVNLNGIPSVISIVSENMGVYDVTFQYQR